MKIVINTNYESAGTKVCVDDLIPRLKKAGHQITRNDWKNYSRFDLALFMSPDADPVGARRQNSRLRCGIMVPMTDYPLLQVNARAADFLLVGSIEARDEQLQYNENIFIYYHFPELAPQIKRHASKQPVIIGYHGNLQHLTTFHPHINQALGRLFKKIPIELWVVYNGKKYGRWQRLPDQVPVRHIQWTNSVYQTQLAHCDIGIVNNTIPQSVGLRHLVTEPMIRYFNAQVPPYRAHDTLVRFKYATNPGRIYPFVQLGIPVVADFAPSMSQFIRDGHSGFIAHSAAGWYQAFHQLASDPSLRQRCADNLRSYIDDHYSLNQNFDRLNRFLIRQAAPTA